MADREGMKNKDIEKKQPEVTANLSVREIAGGYADCEVKLIAAGCKEGKHPTR